MTSLLLVVGNCRSALLAAKHEPLVWQGYKAPEGLKASSDMAAVIQHAELLLMVIPTPFVASTIKGIRDQLRPEQVTLLACILVSRLGVNRLYATTAHACCKVL